MYRKLSLLAALIAFAGPGCGNEAKQATPAATTATASATATSEPEPALEATWGEQVVQLDNAYVVSTGTSALTLLMSNRPLACDDVAPGPQAGGEGRLVALTLAHKLMPDGKRKWVIARAKGYGFGDETLWDDRKQPGAINVATADATKGLSASLEVELQHKKAPKKLRLAGDVLAKGCGVKPPKRKVPAANPQPDLKLTVAGQPFEVAGAKLTLEKDRQVLDLTTAPQDCSFNAAGEIGFSLGLRTKGGGHAFLRGDAIQNNLNTSGEIGVEAKMGAKTGERQVVELSGKTTLFDYEVAVEGKVDAIVCDNR